MPTEIYATNIGEREEKMIASCSQEPPLSALMNETYCMAEEALNRAYRIGQHMFGMNEPRADQLPEAKCFQDVLKQQAAILKGLNATLECIMDKLGV